MKNGGECLKLLMLVWYSTECGLSPPCGVVVMFDCVSVQLGFSSKILDYDHGRIAQSSDYTGTCSLVIYMSCVDVRCRPNSLSSRE